MGLSTVSSCELPYINGAFYLWTGFDISRCIVVVISTVIWSPITRGVVILSPSHSPTFQYGVSHVMVI